jgi:hypothetical protein
MQFFQSNISNPAPIDSFERGSAYAFDGVMRMSDVDDPQTYAIIGAGMVVHREVSSCANSNQNYFLASDAASARSASSSVTPESSGRAASADGESRPILRYVSSFSRVSLMSRFRIVNCPIRS